MILSDNTIQNTNIEFITRQKLETLLMPGPFQVPGIGAVVYKNGHRVFSFAGGTAVLGQQERPFTLDSIFRIASVSKMFTVFSLLRLSGAGLISLDEDVSNYLGFSLRHPEFLDSVITCRSLASHISGIRDGKVYSTPPQAGLKEFFHPEGIYWEDGAHFSEVNEPVNSFFSYCNLNYGILGTVIERITGRRFDEFQRETILKDLEISGDYLPQNISSELLHKRGNIYRKEHEGKWEWRGEWTSSCNDYENSLPLDTIVLQNPYAEEINGSFSLDGYVPGTNATGFAPQGGLRLSLEDMSHTLEMLMNNGRLNGRQVLPEEAVKELLTPQWEFDEKSVNGNTCGGTLLSYGLGTYMISGESTARVCKDYNVDLIGHTGEAFGLQSGIFFRPGTKDGFAYIINGTAISEEDSMAHGHFSGNFIWEEKIMDALCNYMIIGET